MQSRVAIITGAGGGIGRAIARELTRRGYGLTLIGRTETTLQATRDAAVGDALVIPADVTEHEQVEAAVERTLARFGRIDALINNAGIAPVKGIEATSPQLWHEVIDTNLSAAYYLCRSAWPTFRQQGAGVVVNISSFSARDPFPGFLAYGAAKAGLNTFGLALAEEGSAVGVRVHTIGLGAVETPMLRNILSTEQLSPDNTLSPDEVAGVVGACVAGETSYRSGDVIWLSKTT